MSSRPQPRIRGMFSHGHDLDLRRPGRGERSLPGSSRSRHLEHLLPRRVPVCLTAITVMHFVARRLQDFAFSVVLDLDMGQTSILIGRIYGATTTAFGARTIERREFLTVSIV